LTVSSLCLCPPFRRPMQPQSAGRRTAQQPQPQPQQQQRQRQRHHQPQMGLWWVISLLALCSLLLLPSPVSASTSTSLLQPSALVGLSVSANQTAQGLTPAFSDVGAFMTVGV